MNPPTATCFDIELDVLERNPGLGDHDAIELLEREFRLAVNASHFIALSAEDPEVVVRSRTVPQEGVARYALTMEFVPRRARPEAQTVALLRSEFQRALNASYFLHAFVEDPAITISTRELAADETPLRWAA
jgi:hypothetical protein